MTSQAVSPSLNLRSSSYLLPTLRIERRENIKSLNVKISQALGTRNDSNDVGSKFGQSRKNPWVVPIVLDLAALTPDGSPHYTPPRPGMLNGVIELLREFGIVVIGYTNYSPGNQNNDLAGLPSLVSKGLVLNKTPLSVNIEDVIQLVLEKSWTANQENTEQKDTSINPSLTEEIACTELSKTNDPPAEKDETLNIQMKDDDQSSFKNSFVYYGSVRSGQQIMPPQKGQALVVVGSVNSGGEVLSDSDIYVFGKLKGRALAGLNSSVQDSKIIATSFDPELICLGDVFTTVDNVVKDFALKKAGQSAIVTLSSGQLIVRELNL
eukprot:CAMPEP_0194223754 /NCGR_PEP_ID=MMETSP0156-20130528/35835_1 /TAXON_ID=33649 /ORGANISM="Thalassionema nitzschioides, Strain L26-B" /LENGTH=322 /DNA_ID=CAMNT_0038955007 /DNA_START=134 /DNA_END=1102 /DNA_ORIENTATION=+